MHSGGLFDSLTSGIKGLAGTAESAAASRYGPKPPTGPSMPSIPSLGSLGSMGSKIPTNSKSNYGVPSSIIKVIILLIMSFVIGIFFSFINDKNTAFGIDSLQSAMVVVSLVITGLLVAYVFKLGIVDFLLSSEINILAFYFLISYSGISSFITGGFFANMYKLMSTLGSVIIDPTIIFKTGYKLIIPLIFFLIPLFILLYDATKSIFLPFLVLGVSFGVVYMLYPKNDQNPIAGGNPTFNTEKSSYSNCYGFC